MLVALVQHLGGGGGAGGRAGNTGVGLADRLGYLESGEVGISGKVVHVCTSAG